MRSRVTRAFCAVLIAAIVLAGQWSAALAVEVKAAFTRTEDPVILKGSDLPWLLGAPADRLRVVSFREGLMVPVPFQIDPADDKGEMIFRKIVKGAKFIDNLKAAPSRPLGKNDELVLMAGDLGDRADASTLPPGPAVEVTVTDPLDQTKAWAYVLFPSKDAPKISDEKYVRYIPDTDTVVSNHLNFGFTDPKYPMVLTLLALGDGLADPAGLTDLLDRFSMELAGTFKLGLGKVVRRETDLIQVVAGYNEGAVRVVKLLRYSVILIGKLDSPSVERLNASYRSCLSFPNDVSVPFSPGVILEDAGFNLSLDFTSAAKGAKVYHSLFADPIIVDGKMDEAEKEFGKGFPKWAVMSSGFGGIVAVVKVDDSLLKIPGVTTELTYVDDAGLRSEGEDEPGAYGKIGWRFSGLNNLPA